MRTFFRLAVVLLMFSAVPAQAQTPISKEQANNYYFNCKAKPDPRLKPESHDALCACTSVKMMESMSVEDVRTMSGNTQDSRYALNKMLIEVYAPCMSYPVQDLVGKQCLEDKKIDQLGSNIPKPELCNCVADTTAAWFVTEGRNLMRDVLAKNPNIADPVGPVMETPAFKSQMYNSLVTCLTRGG